MRVPTRLSLAATLLALVAGGTVVARIGVARTRGEPPATVAETLLVSTEWLARRLDDPRVVLLHVGHHTEDDFAREHLPGARYLSYMDIITSARGLSTELPPPAPLAAVFERLGVSDGSRVVLYGDPMSVGRAFFTLDYLGHRRVAVLDGGLRKWKAEGRPVTADVREAKRGSFTPRPRPEVVAQAEWVRAKLGDTRIALIDTRTPGEYDGTGDRRGLPSEGHLAGARHLVWEELVIDTESARFRDRAELATMFRQRGAAPGDTVVTYCLVGMRASLSYFVARYLGYPAKMYDGSYDDWSSRGLPLVRGTKPGG
jgi:thiosulfate/3-mercaptopyruvate sulfurtransferase